MSISLFFFSKLYFSLKNISITFKVAIIGVATIIPSIPKKCWNTNNPIIIVTGLSFIALLIITGCNTKLSSHCIATIYIITNTPDVVFCARVTSETGIPPMNGPAYGIKSVIPQNVANNNGALTPKIRNPM